MLDLPSTKDVDCSLLHARAVAVKAAKTAGSLVRARLFENFEVRAKGSAGDVVTELDLASEKVIVALIHDAFPGHRIISEELGVIAGDVRWTWLIDPLDGTNNVAIGVPVLAVGIALCRDGIPVVSVVHEPIAQRTWSAVRGQGAWDTDGNTLQPPPPQTRDRLLLAWSQGYGVARDDHSVRALRMVLSHLAYRVLDLWAPLPCWMMLARGDIDGIVGYRIGEIDLHAGALIAAESGLLIQDFSGGPFVSVLHDSEVEQCLVAGPTGIVAELARAIPVAARLRGQLSDLRFEEDLHSRAKPRPRSHADEGEERGGAERA